MIVGIGIDIVEIDRIAGVLARHPTRFLQKLFTPTEVEYCCGSAQHQARRLAARYAAKEATLKALGIGLRDGKWTEVEVTRDAHGKPSLLLRGRFAEIAHQKGISKFHLSLTHGREFAVAQVVAES